MGFRPNNATQQLGDNDSNFIQHNLNPKLKHFLGATLALASGLALAYSAENSPATADTTVTTVNESTLTSTNLDISTSDSAFKKVEFVFNENFAAGNQAKQEGDCSWYPSFENSYYSYNSDGQRIIKWFPDTNGYLCLDKKNGNYYKEGGGETGRKCGNLAIPTSPPEKKPGKYSTNTLPVNVKLLSDEDTNFTLNVKSIAEAPKDSTCGYGSIAEASAVEHFSLRTLEKNGSGYVERQIQKILLNDHLQSKATLKLNCTSETTTENSTTTQTITTPGTGTGTTTTVTTTTTTPQTNFSVSVDTGNEGGFTNTPLDIDFNTSNTADTDSITGSDSNGNEVTGPYFPSNDPNSGYFVVTDNSGTTQTNDVFTVDATDPEGQFAAASTNPFPWQDGQTGFIKHKQLVDLTWEPTNE